ncbi:hypothetical protein AUR64_10780 [Haloprofundus marisrubri]|uniref:DUF7260 domain-containing protein n=1 Tax=Haloprofundus marisrubri TaxID=1514971 RepID=A0A0W1R9B6_9EURY|nr:hypothetical protein [Haloprofundus marisrubri]KTG10076.1 hypothetical protein AUR64_10780 [Haloprofundus marisrubri]
MTDQPPAFDAVGQTVYDAQHIVRKERRRTVDEREAFRAFGTRLTQIQPASAGHTVPATVRGAGVEDGGSNATKRVLGAYRQTVMAVPHYESEYGDTVGRSIVEEFGPSVGGALVSADGLTPELQGVVAEAAREAASDRESFVSLLDDEAESLAAALDSIETVAARLRSLDDRPLPARSFDELRDLRESVAELERRAVDLHVDRQAEIKSHRQRLAVTDVDLPTFLYQDRPYTYPVLTAATTLAETVARACRRVERQLTVTV